MVLNFELSHIAAQERHKEFVGQSLQDRLRALARKDQLPLARRVARPLGHQLLRLSLLLLRYGKAEAQPTAILARSSVGSVELN